MISIKKEYQPFLTDKLILLFCCKSFRFALRCTYSQFPVHFQARIALFRAFVPASIGVIGVNRRPKNRVNTSFFTIKTSLSGLRQYHETESVFTLHTPIFLFFAYAPVHVSLRSCRYPYRCLVQKWYRIGTGLPDQSISQNSFGSTQGILPPTKSLLFLVTI